MNEKPKSLPVPRRSFLTRFSAGAAAFGAAFAAGARPARAQSAGGGDWSPAMHSQDEWMDQVPGVHRFLIDTTRFEGFRDALLYANNFIDVNRNAYSLENSDVAVIVVARHSSTPFAFNDLMWEKYGETLASQSNYPTGNGGVPTANPVGGSGASGPRGLTLNTLFGKGLQLAVCGVATRGFAGGVARAVGADTQEIYDEISNNLMENSHLVPAGIVAVNRAQERGYSFAYVA